MVTLQEVKTFLGITDTSRDTAIQAYIPCVIDEITSYCNNDFKSDLVLLEDQTGISFVSSTRTINDTASGLAIFPAGYIKIEGSNYNDGFINITTSTASTLTAATTETITDEIAGNEISIYRVAFPKGLKPIVAAIIGQNLANIKPESIQSESIGNYSVSYQSGEEILKQNRKKLSAYMRIKFT